MLSRNDILNIKDLPTETVNIPEWGGNVIVRTMTGLQRDEFEQAVFHDGIKDLTNIRARLCSMSIVDGTGKTLFSDSDIEALGKKNAKALDRVFAIAKKLSGIGRAEMNALKKK